MARKPKSKKPKSKSKIEWTEVVRTPLEGAPAFPKVADGVTRSSCAAGELGVGEILVRHCKDAGIPVFVKQLGTVWSKTHGFGSGKGNHPEAWPEDLRVREMPRTPDGVWPRGEVMAPRSVREQLEAMKRRSSSASSASKTTTGLPVPVTRPPVDPSPPAPKNTKKIGNPLKRISPKRYVMAVTIPQWIACRPELSNAAKLCYGYLAQLWNSYVRCAFPSEADVARALGCSPRTARRAISKLRGLKLITSKSDSIKMPKWKAPKRKRVYRFLKHPWALGAKKLPKKRPSSHPPVIEEDKP